MTKSTRSLVAVFLFSLALLPLAAQAQGTAFTYQGRLMESNAPANGTFEFEFTLFDRLAGGNNLGTLTLEETPVSNGLFTVVLDFGPGAFNGQSRWLEIYARNDGAGGTGVLLTPRQPVMPTPHAMFAAQAAQAATAATATSATNLIGSVSVNQLAGQITSLHLSDGLVANQHVSPTAAIVDTKLATISTAGKVANSATTATSTNSSHTIVLRDATGSFAANQIVAVAGFSGNGSAITGLHADNITTGTINNARLSSSVTLLGNTIEPGELSKPYQSGRYSSTSKAQMPIGRVPVTLPFSPAFASTPMVTLGLQVTDTQTDTSYRAVLNNVSTTGFTAAVYTPVPEGKYAGYSPIGSGFDVSPLGSNLTAVAYLQGYANVTNIYHQVYSNGTLVSYTTALTNGFPSFPFSSLEVAGRTAICYFDDAAQRMRFRRATDLLGTNWAAPVNILSTTNKVMSELVIVNGRPAVAFVENGTALLKFVRANDALGTSWGAPVTVTTNAYWTPRMAVIGGIPGIVFRRNSHGVGFVRANDANGATWAAQNPVFVGGIENPYLSLAEVNGLPAVTYRSLDSASNLRYTRASDVTGTNWPTAKVINSQKLANDTVLGVCDGRPYVLCVSYYNEEVRLLQANDANGDSWSAPTSLSPADTANGYYNYAVRATISEGRMSVMSAVGNSGNSTYYLFQPDTPFELNWMAVAP
jgi:hypothetical protein